MCQWQCVIGTDTYLPCPRRYDVIDVPNCSVKSKKENCIVFQKTISTSDTIVRAIQFFSEHLQVRHNA